MKKMKKKNLMPNPFREYGIQLWPSITPLSPPLAKPYKNKAHTCHQQNCHQLT